MIEYIRAFSYVWGVAALLTGLANIVGGPMRWNTDLYLVLSLIPGTPYSWGVVLVILSVLILLANALRKYLILHYAYAGLALSLLLFSCGIISAAIVSPIAPFTFAIWLVFISVQFVMFSLIFKEEHREQIKYI